MKCTSISTVKLERVEVEALAISKAEKLAKADKRILYAPFP
jgi:hypothetical protein